MSEKMDRNAIVVDLDGTIFLTEERWKRCEEETKGKSKSEFWQCYQSEKYMNLDTPRLNVIKAVRRFYQNGASVIILSGRQKETQLNYTLLQLASCDVPYHEIIMRENKDFRKDVVFKAEKVKELMQKYNILLVIDDSKDVREEIQKLGIKTIPPEELA